MATTVQNPFDTQQASATNTDIGTGLVGSAIQGSAPAVSNETTAPAENLTTAAAPAASTTSTYSPTTREVNPQTGTVQGQVNSILATDSPLMQRARTLATQQMAGRGLVNSSMNAGAGVAAMTDKATAIGAQDANAYNQASSENMAAKNNSGQFNANALNQSGMQATQQSFTAAQTALDRAQQTAMTDKSIKAQQDLQTAQQNFTSAQTALDRSQQTNLQSNQLAATAKQQVVDNQAKLDQLGLQINANKQTIPTTFAANISNTAMTGVNAIMADGNMTAAAKQTAISNLVTYANSQISWAEKFYGTAIPQISTPNVA